MTERPPREEDVKLAEEALELAEKVVKSEEYDIVILDEISVALYLKFISLESFRAHQEQARARGAGFD